MMMKTGLTSTLVVATIAALAHSSAPAAAEDLSSAIGPTADWTGFSIGVNGGYSTGKSDIGSVMGGEGAIGPFSDGGSSIDLSGGLIGGQIGASMQTGAFVFGIVADLDWSGIEGSTNPEFDYFASDQKFSSEVDWLGTVRGKVGFAMDKALIYGTSGFAFGGVTDSFQDSSGDKFSNSDSATGWAAGGGVEYSITDNFSAGVEYLYVDLGDRNFDYTNSEGHFVSGDVDTHLNVFRGTLNYRFR